jgi:hypothetical protein
MGRAKSGIAAAGVIVMLLGVGTVLFMQGKGDSNHANSVVASTSDKAQPAVVPILPTMAPASSPATTVAPSAQAKGTTPTTKAPAKAPAAATPTTLDSTPSAQEIQQVIAGLTVQLQQTAAANGSGTPLTKEQVEAQLRLMLKQLGIPYPAS